MSEPSSPIRKMVVGLLVLAVVCSGAAVGYMYSGWSPGDAAYMVVITVFSVGYGEVQPITTWPLRTMTVMLIVWGYGAVIYAVGGFVQLVVDGELNRALGARRMTKEITELEGHTIICGYGRMGTTLARELESAGRPFVAIDTHGGDFNLLDEDHQHLMIQGDATEEDVLERAGIRRAKMLASVLSDDATNVFVTLTARQMNPDLTIIARGEDRRTENKLRTCGADTVVMPTTIGASMISQLILRPNADGVLDRLRTESNAGSDLTNLGLQLDELIIDEASPFIDKTVADIEMSLAHGCLIVGYRSVNGTTLMHPAANTRVSAGDVAVVLGYADVIPVRQPEDRLAASKTTPRRSVKRRRVRQNSAS